MSNYSPILELKDHYLRLVDDKAITYPEDANLRNIVNKMAARSLDKFTIGDLKPDFSFITKSVMDRLETQRYVVKEGNGWKIAPINTYPPWGTIYSFIEDKRQASPDEIRDYLNDKYVLQCPSNDENHMVAWYLEILLSQNMVSVDTKNGKPIYQSMDHSGRLDGLLHSCNDQLKEFEETIKAAAQLQISTSDYANEKDGFISKIERLQEKITIGSQEVTESLDILTELKKSLDQLKKEITNKKKVFSSLVESKDTIFGLFSSDIKNSFSEGYITDDERKSWTEKVEVMRRSLKSNLEEEIYSNVVILANELDKTISLYRTQMAERRNSKDPCIVYAGKYDAVIDETGKILQSLDELRYSTVETRKQVEELSNRYEREYKPLFNAGKYDEAKTSINNIFTDADDLQTALNQLLSQYQGYAARIERLGEKIKGNPELQSSFDDLQKTLASWDFATVEIKIKKFEKLASASDQPVKSQEEIFIEKFGKGGKISLDEVLKKYSIDEAFKIIKNLASDQKIKHIELRFK